SSTPTCSRSSGLDRHLSSVIAFPHEGNAVCKAASPSSSRDGLRWPLLARSGHFRSGGRGLLSRYGGTLRQRRGAGRPISLSTNSKRGGDFVIAAAVERKNPIQLFAFGADRSFTKDGLPSPLVGEGRAKRRMRGSLRGQRPLIRLAAASRQRSTSSHKGRRKSAGSISRLERTRRAAAGLLFDLGRVERAV